MIFLLMSSHSKQIDLETDDDFFNSVQVIETKKVMKD
ncbi:hypothetical protein FHS70_001345 [Flammeovirga yaeyamensis]|nr:hypothetical protein [Flammeovirga yaeyamensis]